ncbi:O-methyltransferase ZRP4 [Zea mays]|uniref:O-methyltransferase ZRP4 n=1 Tax=Zea mays TaxID=4577 RepID=A0A1D6PSX7_MAIZE|nr:O-methyltransferase ZRP4 [Zea mays]
MGHQAQHGTDDTEELLAAHRQLWCHALGYVKSMALKCALDLRIPDTIDRCGGSATLGELLAASEIPASNHDYLRRVMRTLTAMRIFAVSHDDPAKADDAAAISYQLTPASRLLVSSSSSSVDAAAAGAGASKENTTTPSILPNIAHLVRPNTISLLFSMGEWMKDESAASVSLYETEHEWRRIFLAAGFRDYKITHTRGIPSIIEVFP